MCEILLVIRWPLVVIIGMIIFRKALNHIIKELDYFKYREFEATFGKRVKSVEKETERLIHGESNLQGRVIVKGPEPASDLEERFKKMAEVSPKGAIMDAWRELEFDINKIAEKNNIDTKKNKNIAGITDQLTKIGVFDNSVQQMIDDMRQLRNQAAHEPERNFTLADTSSYCVSASNLAIHFAKYLV